MHFQGIVHAKESQAFLIIACLKALQIIAPISAKKVCMQTLIFLCNVFLLQSIFNANNSKLFLLVLLFHNLDFQILQKKNRWMQT